MAIKCHIDRVLPTRVAGWAWDPADGDAEILVEAFYDDRPLGTVSAGEYRADLERNNLRGGRCAFQITVPPGSEIVVPEKLRLLFSHPQRPDEKQELIGRRTEDDGEIDFGPNPIPVLQPLGLTLTALRGKCRFGAGTFFEPPVVVHSHIEPGSVVQVGAFSGVFASRIQRCTIGRYCSLAPDVVIGPNEHPLDWLTTSVLAEQPGAHGWAGLVVPDRAQEDLRHGRKFDKNHRRTVIGNDVWIGNGVFIRCGATIGDGAVIGARSVVVSDIPSYAIAVGNPARVIRYRFDDRTIERLTALQWWRFNIYDFIDQPLDKVGDALDRIEDLVARDALKPYAPERWTVPRIREALAAVRK
jgi:acetyltransferase-like isoleucine patch superfamily enzyme